MRNQYIGEDCLKRGAWTVRRFKEGVVFLRGRVDTPMDTTSVGRGTHKIWKKIDNEGLINEYFTAGRSISVKILTRFIRLILY